jgi:ubiquinone/menaquinone biosynthesis C-methylase UbiE
MIELLNKPVAPDFEAIKAKQRVAWASGDYSAIGVTAQIVSENLCEALDLRAGQTVLDVAAGNGACSLAAARRFCDVTSTDYVESLLQRGAERAAAERLPIVFHTADAEWLPFEDDSFDVVTSTFGVMFAPDQVSAAAELLRVCRKGGKIGLANWTPDSFVGQMFKLIGRHVPQPAGLASPTLWGTQIHLYSLFCEQSKFTAKTCVFTFRYHSAQHFIDSWRQVYGPLERAFVALDADGQAELEAEIKQLIDMLNVADDGTMVVPSPYLEVVITK